MRRLVGVLAVLAILSTVVAGAYAAPEVPTGAVGPYEGAFQGVAYAGEASRAPLALELTHRGNQVEGTVFLGEGLYVDGGMCGAVNVPATALAIGGQTVLGDPRRLVTRPTFDLGDFEIAVDFESDLSVDGKVITAEATIDLPWFCGRDPVFIGTLHRDSLDPQGAPRGLSNPGYLPGAGDPVERDWEY